MSKKLYEESNLQAIGNTIREKLGGNATYLPSEMASAIGQIHGEPALETLNVNQNGTYTPAQGKDGFSSVSVNVPSGGSGILIQKSIIQNGTYDALTDDSADGYSSVIVNVPSSGGEGPIYSGTSTPASSLGNNEDLYVQYEEKSGNYNYTYATVAQYRKVNGAWIPYTLPVTGIHAVHIWTHSTGGNDASLYIQEGFLDNDTFVAIGEIEKVLYTSVNSWNTAKNCYGLVLVAYVSSWQIKSLVPLTDGNNTYRSDMIVHAWSYDQNYDFYLWTPLTSS